MPYSRLAKRFLIRRLRAALTASAGRAVPHPIHTPAHSFEPEVCEDVIFCEATDAAICKIMAKTAKLKRLSQAKSPHSRAARRASSPSINLDKSLKNIVAPSAKKPLYASVLAVQRGSGVTKRKACKSQKRQQRLRHEKGMERAEAVMDKVAAKLEKGKAKEKVVKERGADWDEHNRKLPRKQRELAPNADVAEDVTKTDEEEEWEEMSGEEPTNENPEEEKDEVL